MKLQWIVQQDEKDLLLREFLYKKNISRTALSDIKFKGGQILVNGQEETVRRKVTTADEVTVYFPPERKSESLLAEEIPLCIVYEDDAVLVLNKQAGVSTIPSREHPSGSIANGLLYYYDKIGLDAGVHVVTRLDRNTSGLMLIAKHRYVHYICSLFQKAGEISRTYEALVHGSVVEQTGTIDAPIGRREDSIIEREVRSDGQHAVTHFKVIQRYEAFTHVRLQLETGRTHQIRVHMAYLGHSLLGDDLYGGGLDLINRQALHSAQLTFIHPITSERISFSASPPDDMEQIISGT
ncbi:RluA family pseudouridine synthase [Bacillus sp. HMF5848]|uniref:RluA family pseudouridine synthase n=1 Tax=Bacillus sp. HMF5848 TaxID=2495421 RepID=UPI000F7BA549|nr:RluA family pseudouridine synthase [Bacillus sp. HMF5848]RSK26500.1 RluA family pseudouridine synthase [Bacillus sp. HMF5848]